MPSLQQAPSAGVVADAYHAAWTSGRFDDAVQWLDPHVSIEVPINDYPTRESFAQALASFGALVQRAELLASFAGDEEALLLYDMAVPGIGVLRMAEHFTVRAGKIVRLRQVHDTAPIRSLSAAGST